MKRYVLFAGFNYEASGGWWDFVTSSNSKKYLKQKAKKSRTDWHHIVDLEVGKIVAEYKE